MEEIVVYGIRACGSVQKARKYLDSRGIAYEFIDVKTTPLESTFLAWLAEQVGTEVLLNTKGTTYKKLGLKAQDLSQEQKLHAMLEYPLLIKRPVIVYTHSGKKQVLVGFDESRLAEVFG